MGNDYGYYTSKEKSFSDYLNKENAKWLVMKYDGQIPETDEELYRRSDELYALHILPNVLKKCTQNTEMSEEELEEWNKNFDETMEEAQPYYLLLEECRREIKRLYQIFGDSSSTRKYHEKLQALERSEQNDKKVKELKWRIVPLIAKELRPHARTRAPRSARRASFSVAASSPGGGDSSGDPDSGDPPGPYPFRSFVTPPSNRKHNQEPSRPWLGLGCCLMERGRSA